jgi:CTP synthase
LSANVIIKWVLSEDIEKNGTDQYLSDVDAIIVPGGFGDRGIEGKIQASAYARTHKIPYLGLCLGMQIAVIDFARNVAKMEHAHSTEFDSKTPYPVIDLMPDQHNVTLKGGTMRLGRYPCNLKPGSKASHVYGADVIWERHRHRYEVSNELRDKLAKAGMIFCGVSPDNKLVEMIELPDHPFFLASQFHPELKSRPDNPHPLFVGLVDAGVHEHARRTEKIAAAKALDNLENTTAAVSHAAITAKASKN